MKIKINEQNRAAINAALVAANGRAQAHTFNGATPILEAAVSTEAKLELLGLNKAQRVGATATSTSGRATSRNYKHPRTTTFITIKRGNRDWHLMDVTTHKNYNYSAGGTVVSLTAAQDEIVTKAFRSSHKLQPIAIVATPLPALVQPT